MEGGLTYEEIREGGFLILYHSGHVLVIVPQTLVYSMYASLMPIATYIMLKRGLRTKTQKFLFGMSLFMFVLATVYWTLSFASLIRLIQIWFFEPWATEKQSELFLPMWNAIILLNYVLTDGVVVWRAWVLCQDYSRKFLYLAIFFLICSAFSVTATIIIRLLLYTTEENSPVHHDLARAIDITQVANLVLSILTNVTSTSIISVKAWRFRRVLKQMLRVAKRRRTSGSRIMMLLVESGIIYCLSCITVLVATLIPLERGTLGDIYTPVNVQLAGMYPVVVLLFVNGEYSLEQTEFASTIHNMADGESQARDIDRHRLRGASEASRLETIQFRTVATTNSTESRGDDMEIASSLGRANSNESKLMNAPDMAG
ncbi:hypothetical protein VKT23_015480 [Stygiomarasmius scandens]|uniref:Uncharacterized protein n=1 Tax=Marasmiellus scandens TaxID=2682957 RepID=A0ABR1IZ77_9AGAR